MYFHKIPHPVNHAFPASSAGGKLALGRETFNVAVKDLGGDVFHVGVRGPRWQGPNHRHAVLASSFPQASTCAVTWGKDGLEVSSAAGAAVLASTPGKGFGVEGSRWVFQFERDGSERWYGQGEKCNGLEKSGKRAWFWNTDAWGDFTVEKIRDGIVDPLYVAIPYTLIQIGGMWLGILIDNPGATYMDTGSEWVWSWVKSDDMSKPDPQRWWFGGEDGQPGFYLIAGATPAEVTRRYQQLVGTQALPPLWALGHHQCKWGYKGEKDLLQLDAAFTKNQIPTDGLWLDIDYMQGYRVFTTNRTHLPKVKKTLADLAKRGRRVVPILDPGVKADGYPIDQDGISKGIFCKTAEGNDFVGYVWPGRTHFPDFSTVEGRAWWAEQVKTFHELGWGGYWLDMNDPSTGSMLLEHMRFGKGELAHWTWHNQFALGMAEASRAGVLAARPDERPFLISRSGAVGQAQFSAIWTGDNYSNWHHLRGGIPMALNLSISGVPFCGPDVPGFGGSADKILAIAWYKAGFLFPFFRNHAGNDSAPQEPWVFGTPTMTVIRHYIRLRYKLLPYLYNLFVRQAESGEPVLRPLFLDFKATKALPLDRIEDQFLVGPDVMQAPVVHEGTDRRTLVLPGAGRWFDAMTGRFLKAGRSVAVQARSADTPLFLREGAIIPMQTGERIDNRNDLADIEMHVLLGKGAKATASCTYAADDGLSFGFERGERSTIQVTANRVGSRLEVTVTADHLGWKPVSVRVVGYDGITAIAVTTAAGRNVVKTTALRWRMTGKPIACRIAAPVLIG